MKLADTRTFGDDFRRKPTAVVGGEPSRVTSGTATASAPVTRLKPMTVSAPTGQTTVVPPPTRSTVPAGRQLGTPSTPYITLASQGQPVTRAAPAPAPVVPASSSAAQVSAFTGNEAPYTVMPTQPAATQELRSRAQQEAMRALEQPTAFDDELFQGARDQALRLLDEDFGRQEERLTGDLAARGLDYSSVAAGNLNDLRTERARAGGDLLQDLLLRRAETLASGRQQALSGALGVAQSEAGLDSAFREELRGERSYSDFLRTSAREQAIQDFLMEQDLAGQSEASFQQLLQQAMAQGDPSRLLAALNSGAAGYASPAAAYGAQAEMTNEQLQQLAELAGQIFGPKPAG